MATKFTWYGHGTMGLEIAGKQVVVDPYFTDNPACSTSPDSLSPDYILISHGHGDHVADAIPLAKRSGAKVISNFEIANWCAAQGVSNTEGMHIGGGCNFAIGYVKLTQAMHGSALPDGSNGGNPAGFLLSTPDNERIYLACDTGLFGDMRMIGEDGLDLAVLPIGDHFTMGPDDALKAVKLLSPKHVIPVHYNTWEPIRQDANAWAKRVEAETSAKAHVLQPGGTFTL